jgi:L-ascorbate metabolism protein UlaG (beta-lactamase superfamily)
MPRLRAALAVTLLAPVLAAASPLTAEVTVSHVANAGFLLAAGESRVLVDALFDEGIDGYGRIPAALRPALEGGSSPFDGVDVALATHAHGDHFAAGAVVRFLTANPRAWFVSTPQAVEAVAAEAGAGSAIAARAIAVLPEEGSVERLQVGDLAGIGIRAMNLHHGRGQDIQNVGFLVNLGGVTVLHVGDTVASTEELAALDMGHVDLALLTSWVISARAWGKPLIDALGAPRVAAMHLATADAPASFFSEPGGQPALVQSILRVAPTAEVFTAPLQSMTCCEK